MLFLLTTTIYLQNVPVIDFQLNQLMNKITFLFAKIILVTLLLSSCSASVFVDTYCENITVPYYNRNTICFKVSGKGTL
jgi:hypothetical protein